MARVSVYLHLLVMHVSTILVLVGFATPAWSNYKTIKVLAQIPSTAGLFQQCVADTCSAVKDKFADVLLPLILAVLSVATSCISCVLADLLFWKRNEKSEWMHRFHMLLFLLASGAAISGTVSCMIYSYALFTETVKPGYSFFLMFSGSMGLCIAGAFSYKK